METASYSTYAAQNSPRQLERVFWKQKGTGTPSQKALLLKLLIFFHRRACRDFSEFADDINQSIYFVTHKLS